MAHYTIFVQKGLISHPIDVIQSTKNMTLSRGTSVEDLSLFSVTAPSIEPQKRAASISGKQHQKTT